MITRPIAENLFHKDGKGADGSTGVIVPRKGLAEIKKIIGDREDSEVGIEIAEGFLVVDVEGTRLSMRLIDGVFPDYHQVLPKQKGTLAFVNRQEFTQALRRMALLVTDKAKCVKLEVAASGLRISSSSPELGEATEEIACQYKGSPLSVGFNAKYLLDVASAQTSADQLCMELHGELGPGKFYPENDESCVAIVMPMRL
jgi:DNA polymerase-3 subunit beta